jgi:hypothetical protein
MGKRSLVEDPAEKDRALAVISDHILPGRWADIRKPSEGELKATTVLRMPILEGAAKVRNAGAKDDPEDMSLDVWAGLLPLRTIALPPEPDEKLKAGIALPDYLEEGKHRWKG